MHDKVDVLIIGSGASGAAVAWSLADTKMRILCLEQGDWVKPTDYPSNGRDWEARAVQRLRHQPQPPRARDRLSDQRRQLADQGGELQRRRRQHHHVHGALSAPATQSDFKVQTLDGVADDWPVDYDTLEPFFAENDRMMGVSGLAGDPGLPAPPAAHAAAAARQVRPALRPGDEQARLALVAVRLDHRHRPTTKAAARCINLGHCTPGCAQGAKASTDITYWPHAIRAGVELRTRCRVREITTDETAWRRA